MSDLNESFNASLELELLFKNRKLEALKYLLVLYIRNKKIGINELLYYYSIINIGLDDSFDTPRINVYLKDKKAINQIVLFLDNLNFIIIDGNLTQKLENFKVKITDDGKDFIEKFEVTWMKEYLQSFEDIISLNKYEEKKNRFNQMLIGDEIVVKSE
ncbi:TPA: hypothetical protein ACNIAK_002227 [Enterococcus faecalis]|uniref:hypothetical protein n=1 Tax=Enterococcus faecalis TaxID=1351 RepID=UPI001E56027A|nr:hypothetical protein [Enterococcus faecalis]EMC0698284.1 hypothetical protein [Enterococcus faecalis]MCD5130297.1 hypothetical protein [Enterococcus faecalis]MDV2557211.1 hypothetical protein [Enterococcus faecalis]MDY2531930.1 hypothetical protein [Enterococcus faecalis]UQQ63235.1 hypothetical protein LQ054_04930 [Enterococcus faecalis]